MNKKSHKLSWSYLPHLYQKAAHFLCLDKMTGTESTYDHSVALAKAYPKISRYVSRYNAVCKNSTYIFEMTIVFPICRHFIFLINFAFLEFSWTTHIRPNIRESDIFLQSLEIHCFTNYISFWFDKNRLTFNE